MKESARAGMRRIVKRLLKKYKYPPEGQEAALETIITQCEMWSENNNEDSKYVIRPYKYADDDIFSIAAEPTEI